MFVNLMKIKLFIKKIKNKKAKSSKYVTFQKLEYKLSIDLQYFCFMK